MFVIDTKHYRGRRVSVRSQGGWGRPRTQSLMVDGRDKSTLLAGVQWQAQVVRERLSGTGGADVPVIGLLCFVDADWSPGIGAFLIDGVPVLWPAKLKDVLLCWRALDQAAIDHWHLVAAGAFRPA